MVGLRRVISFITENALTPNASLIAKLKMLNTSLSSRCGKKLGVSLANSAAGLYASWICDRAGWCMKNVHTFFEYAAQLGGMTFGWHRCWWDGAVSKVLELVGGIATLSGWRGGRVKGQVILPVLVLRYWPPL